MEDVETFETYGITNSYDEWKNYLKSPNATGSSTQRDMPSLEALAKKVNKFLLGNVALENGKVLTVTNKAVSDISEIDPASIYALTDAILISQNRTMVRAVFKE